MIKLEKVLIENFKAYKEETSFSFNDSQFILISGSNGFGKTTIIDAIEWGITGTIKRIEIAYFERNSKKKEQIRGENNTGIIKNKFCDVNDAVKVTLFFKIDKEQVIIERSQNEDKINGKSKVKYVKANSEEIKKKIEKLLKEDSFYQYFICDTQKAYRFLNKTREDVKNQFQDFLKNRTIENCIIDNLQKVVEWNDNIVANESKKITEVDKINEKQKKIDEFKEKTFKELTYPTYKFYETENVDITSMGYEEINKQKGILEQIAYQRMRFLLQVIVSNENKKKNNKQLKKISEVYSEKKKKVIKAVALKLWDDSIISEENNRISDLQKIVYELTTENFFSKIELNKNILKDSIDKIRIQEKKNENDTINSIIKEKDEEIENLEKGNAIIKILSNIVAGKEGLVEYKEKSDLCPVCGKDGYKNIKNEEIAIQAQKYVEEQNTKIVDLKKQLSDSKDKRINLVKGFLKETKDFLNEDIESKVNEVNTWRQIYQSAKTFFELCDKNSINYKIEGFSDQYIVDSISNGTKPIMDNSEYTKVKQEFMNLKTLLDWEKGENDDYNKMYIIIQSYINTEYEFDISNIQFDIFSQKWTSLLKIYANNEIKRLNDEIIKIKQDNEKINNQIATIKSQNGRVTKRLNEIKKYLSRLEKAELTGVGNYIYKIFYKIIKHTDIEDFKLSRDGAKTNSGVVINDQNQTNILNILSEGQLSIFLLSMFIGNAIKRKNEIEFKTYFLDDITSSMDDMNVLNFVELIKYQLSSHEGIFDQFFFSTCDGGLERMFLHKMSSFDVKWENIKFNYNAHGIMEYSNGEETTF
ncbi:AAA family ATPase [Clostridium felsineum]|uniref:AAA family ATPase n=1 Tax=Clostridium felsineum TaxID=36839 RepID=UPI00214D43AA|nr:hypothetical protein [Clostridium felsineum]MCR3758137.1 AAA family ATPase [Clostridium felsineum]